MVIVSGHHGTTLDQDDSKLLRSHRIDLHLAESYIPAALLCFKILFYTLMVPVLMHVPIKTYPIVIAFFCGILYVDHLYFPVSFIDTTVICLDVLGSSVLLLSLIMLNNNSGYWEGSVALTVWGISSLIYYLLQHTKCNNNNNNGLCSKESNSTSGSYFPVYDHRPTFFAFFFTQDSPHHRALIHSISFAFFIWFVSLRCFENSTPFSVVYYTQKIDNGKSDILVSMLKSIHLNNTADIAIYDSNISHGEILSVSVSHFYLRSLFYTFLVLIDFYTNYNGHCGGTKGTTNNNNISDRIFVCKYGAILFSQWQLATLLFILHLAAHIFKIFVFYHTPSDVESLLLKNRENNNHNINNSFHEDQVKEYDEKISNSFHKICIVNHKFFNVNSNDNGISMATANTAEILSSVPAVELDVMEAFRRAKQQYSMQHNHVGKNN